ncbi:nuclear pore complex assembly-domain-containing protein [Ganoderma leucocontextum]|nr:nuclear pore complex assembly-domain-containing protein [Ganoderma leucocontextum]
MDADVSMSSEGEDYCKYFDLDEPRFAFRGSRPQEIEVRRAHMSDLLIFDILLISGGIRHPDTLYPPRTPESLKRLLEAISHSQFDGLKKDCLVYFLLKWHQDYREESFVKDRVIPAQFTALSDAYWHLDTGIHIERAVSILSDARLNRDYPSKVIQALFLAQNSHSLIRSYIRTVKPLLTEPDDIDTYTIALAESNLSEAWSYQRTFPEVNDTRKRLVRKILHWCLAPKPRKTSLTHLLAFPFSGYEQSLVHDYALEPPSYLPSSSIPVIQDLVCVRLVQSGQHATAIKLDRQFSSVSRGGEKGQKAAQDRRQMMDELMAAMPAAERNLLELELEQFAQGHDLIISASGDKDKGKSADLGASVSMSWEHIAPSPSASVIKTTVVPPTPPIPQRSNAPRFGGPAPVAPTVEEMFPSISRSGPPISTGKPASSSGTQMPKPPTGPLVFGGISTQPSGTVATSAANGWLTKGTTTNGANGSAVPSIFGSGKSLFDTAGSANAAANAFYQPPPASTSAKRPNLFASLANPRPVSAFADLSTVSASGKPQPAKAAAAGADGNTSVSSIKGPHDADISMLSELSDGEGDSAALEGESISVARHLDDSADMDVSAEFSVSVFGRGGRGRGVQDEAVSSGRRRKGAMAEAEAMLPPGAFVQEDEGEKQQEQEQEPSVSAGAKTSASAGKGRGKRTRASAGGRGATREPSPPRAPEPEPEPVRTRTSVADVDALPSNRQSPGPRTEHPGWTDGRRRLSAGGGGGRGGGGRAAPPADAAAAHDEKDCCVRYSAR